MSAETDYRKTTQDLAPLLHSEKRAGEYDIYPGLGLPGGQVASGYADLAQRLSAHSQIILDGFSGVLWEDCRRRLDAALQELGIQAAWQSVDQALLPTDRVEALAAPFLGGEDPLFGTRFTGLLEDFFDPAGLKAIRPNPAAALNIVYGCGAALCGWEGLLVYLDVPNNEIQFRSRAGSICNLGCAASASPKIMYKRFYFLDWVALSAHKAALLPRMDVVVDAQRPADPVWMAGADLRAALQRMSRSVFRVRPWFEPGPWGGHWIQKHIPDLAQNVPNYAWSFELISPENGLMLHGSDGRMLEVSFDFLMFQEARAVLGDGFERFGVEFPIRYDFLDTFSGGNLSVQVHPRPEYALGEFGENFTQDEAYYILDCEPGARVYLGFQPGIQPEAFRAVLEVSFAQSTPVEIDRFVNSEPSRRHDLFLIPNGTIHGAGVDNLVLEISATPYIFTFKMYDWMRLDLDGRPRPLNIRRAFENLYFERQGEVIRQEHISRPHLIAQGEDWQRWRLPSHPAHFYDVHRLEFSGRVEVETARSPHVLSLVEGDSVLLETAGGRCQRFSYAETFTIPAAAERYTLISEAGRLLKVVATFLKPAAP